jgi:hypothetical protein
MLGKLVSIVVILGTVVAGAVSVIDGTTGESVPHLPSWRAPSGSWLDQSQPWDLPQKYENMHQADHLNRMWGNP